ncbi:MAG: DNA gyrase inhibitor YacG [Thermoguttaceae bacterium]|nr:DNA gyrase inhibitor YacG [Thermoguttaceae bacterium]MDW8037751.1 DNA gyrase inhibitor YacG [Thermoguttaceae bacterium]
MREHLCPICGRAVDPGKTSAMPFCSERCRQIDLARWLGERYRIPGPAQSPEQPLDQSPSEASSAMEDSKASEDSDTKFSDPEFPPDEQD